MTVAEYQVYAGLAAVAQRMEELGPEMLNLNVNERINEHFTLPIH